MPTNINLKNAANVAAADRAAAAAAAAQKTKAKGVVATRAEKPPAKAKKPETGNDVRAPRADDGFYALTSYRSKEPRISEILDLADKHPDVFPFRYTREDKQILEAKNDDELQKWKIQFAEITHILRTMKKRVRKLAKKTTAQAPELLGEQTDLPEEAYQFGTVGAPTDSSSSDESSHSAASTERGKSKKAKRQQS